MRTRTSAIILAAIAALLVASSAMAAGTSRTGKTDVIVVFENSVARPAALARRLVAEHGATASHVYRHALKGFAASLPAPAIEALRDHRRVAFVEPDAPALLADTTQSPATWGIDRIDQRDLPLSNSYVYAGNGAGVQAYVIDTGIRFDHVEFGGRAVFGADYVGDGRNGVDCHGHGTHVAGTIGGQTYGVAKGVGLIAMRTHDCAGNSTWAKIIAALDFVVARKVASPATPMVVNLSVQGSPDAAMDAAVSNTIGAGISVVAAAGNGVLFGGDACNVTPARVPAAMTVGATTSSDARALYSNYGACLDWFAPGDGITSAGIGSSTATSVRSGTSMAAPHTVGVAALYLQGDPDATPQEVRDALYAATTKDKVGSANSANDHLIYSRLAAPPPPPPNNPPSAGDLAISTAEDTATTWTPDVADPDPGAILTCSMASQPGSGSASVAADCSSGSYAPVANANGSTSFSYRVSDGLATDTGSVSVSVSPVNDPPTAAGESYTTAFGTTLVRNAPGVLGNDADIDGDALSAVLASGPSHGTLTLGSDGGFSYTPAAGYSGADAFSYRARDPSGAESAPATVGLTVTAAGATSVRIADLDATRSGAGKNWTASVTVEVRNDLGAAVTGAVVTGSFSPAGGTGRTCTTGSNGRCPITSSAIPKRNGSVVFTVTAVATSLPYTPGANSDPDGDSNGTSITITKP